MVTKKTETTEKKPAAKRAKSGTRTKAANPKPQAPQHIGLVEHDSWLEPFEGAIRGRHDHALWKKESDYCFWYRSFIGVCRKDVYEIQC